MANEQLNKYLTLARRAREEDNTEDAKKFYDMVRIEDPENIEARFFYAYYKMWEGKKIEVYSNYLDLISTIKSVLKAIATAEISVKEKEDLLKTILNEYKDLPLTINRTLNELARTFPDSGYGTKIRQSGRESILLFYHIGDYIEKEFIGSNFKSIAVEAWKLGVARQQIWYGVGVDKSLPETYTAKIQKIDASYVMPKKAGCISFSK